MSDVDFDAYWQGVADRAAVRRQAYQKAMKCKREAKANKGKPPKKKKRGANKRGQPVQKRGFVRPDYREYIKSRAWAAKRKEALAYHGRKCAICGSDRNLEVHHLTYKRLGREKMKDLQVTCKDCHRIHHEDKPGVVTTDYLSEQFRAIIG